MIKIGWSNMAGYNKPKMRIHNGMEMEVKCAPNIELINKYTLDIISIEILNMHEDQ